jgi:hypothetical protein
MKIKEVQMFMVAAYSVSQGSKLALHLRSTSGAEIQVFSFATSASPFLSYDFALKK